MIRFSVMKFNGMKNILYRKVIIGMNAIPAPTLKIASLCLSSLPNKRFEIMNPGIIIR